MEGEDRVHPPVAGIARSLRAKANSIKLADSVERGPGHDALGNCFGSHRPGQVIPAELQKPTANRSEVIRFV